MVTAGCQLSGPERGVYSERGPFADHPLHGARWNCEPYNNWLLCFYEDK
jgi:hypothetical protein